jgi:hypothetical protein
VQIQAGDLDRFRRPVTIRPERGLALRGFLAGSVVVWAFVLRDFHYLQDRIPIEEDGVGYMVRSTELELWWAPLLGVVAGLLLLLPETLTSTWIGRIMSAVVVAALVAAGGLLIGWAAPIQAYREGALFDRASAANVALTVFVFVLPGVLALVSASVLLARAGACSTARAKAMAAWSVVPVVAAIPLGVGLAQSINGVGLRTVTGFLMLLAMILIPLALLVGWWTNPLFGNLRLVAGGLVLTGAAFLMVLGLVLGLVCLFASSPLDDYLCSASLAALALGQGGFLYGWVLNTRGIDSRNARRHPSEG